MKAGAAKADRCLNGCLHGQYSLSKDHLSKLNSVLTGPFLMLNSIIATV